MLAGTAERAINTDVCQHPAKRGYGQQQQLAAACVDVTYLISASLRQRLRAWVCSAGVGSGRRK